MVFSAGCTNSIPPMDGRIYISDENVTHQKWMTQYEENPKKYLNDPENPLEWTLKGLQCAANNGHDEALLYFDTAIEGDAQFAPAYYSKAVSLFNLKQYDEAEECLQKAIEINSQYEALAEKLRGNHLE